MSESRNPQPVTLFDKSAPIMRKVNPDFPGDGKPRLAFYGIAATHPGIAAHLAT